jgi:hypothetical protein
MSDGQVNSIGTGSIISRFDHVQAAINPEDIVTNWHDVPTSLCKEEVMVWEELGLDWRNIKCNCLY